MCINTYILGHDIKYISQPSTTSQRKTYLVIQSLEKIFLSLFLFCFSLAPYCNGWVLRRPSRLNTTTIYRALSTTPSWFTAPDSLSLSGLSQRTAIYPKGILFLESLQESKWHPKDQPPCWCWLAYRCWVFGRFNRWSVAKKGARM